MRKHALGARGGYSLAWRLIDDLEAIFFDDRVGQNFLGNAFELFLCLVAVPAIQMEDEELALADVFHRGIAKSGERIVEGDTSAAGNRMRVPVGSKGR